MDTETEVNPLLAPFTALAKGLQHTFDKWTDYQTLPDGRRVRAKMKPDDDCRLEDDGDWFGKIEWEKERRSERNKRPEGFDGGAVVVGTDRHNVRVWLQPPKDVEGDVRKSMIDRVKAYYRDEWTFITLHLQVESAACTCCGESKVTDEYLGGVESDITIETGLADMLMGMLDS